MPTTEIQTTEIHLAHTQGFCAGVSSAIDTVNLALEKFGTPLYVRHEIVHNTSVIKDFEKRGVIFIDTLSEIPPGSHVIFSAHGVAPVVYEDAKEQNLHFIDATCPLVTKVHREALTFSKQGVQTILIGHRGHQELIGTSGYVNPELLHIVETESDIETLAVDPTQPVGYLTQTTLSVSETAGLIQKLKAKFPGILGPPKEDICYATQNRQDAVLELARSCDVVIICGSPASSNSNRLRETAASQGIPSFIIDTAEEFQETMITGKKKVGVSSGASVPGSIVEALIEKIKSLCPGATLYQKASIEKKFRFPIPKF